MFKCSKCGGIMIRAASGRFVCPDLRCSNMYNNSIKNNWIKKYEVSYENKFKPDTLSIELREIEYYK